MAGGQEQSISQGARGNFGSLGKYRLIAKLGHGGMADVFLAVVHGPASFNKLVVLKRPRISIEENEGYALMFLDEAKLAARLNHPNIVQTYEVGESDDAYLMVMEYLEGQPLSRITRAVAKGEPGAAGFTRATWVRIVAEILSGLHSAHELCDYDGTPLRIVHRDVSPQNIFVTYDGAVKIVDFGIAKAVLNTTHTETGIFKGKVHYTAPEQVMGSKEFDRRADLFAAGIVLWELITQTRLFKGDSVTVLHQLMTNEIPRLSAVLPEVEPVLDDIVAKALERDPANRFATAQEMRQALEGYLRLSGEDVRADELGSKMLAMFADRRAHVRLQIKSYLERNAPIESGTQAGRRGLPGGLNVSNVRATFTGLPTLEDGSMMSPSSSIRSDHYTSHGTDLTHGVYPARDTSKRKYTVGGLALVALIGAVVVAVRPWSKEAPVAPATTAPDPGQQEAAPKIGVLSVMSDPAEATVSWDGRVLGKTPLRVDLPVGTQNISVTKQGFFDGSLVATISLGGVMERSITLRPRADAPVASVSAAPAKSATADASPKHRPVRGAVQRPTPTPARPTPGVQPTAPVVATPEPPPSVRPGRPGIQILDDNAKPAVKVDVVQ